MTQRAQDPVYALGKFESGAIFLLTKFDEDHRDKTEYIPVFRNLTEAEMELRLLGSTRVSVLSFNSAEELQRKHPRCPVRYEFDLLLPKSRTGHV